VNFSWSEHPWTVATIVVYLAALILIGIWAARRTRDARDFFIAGQRLGLFVTAMATMSAAFSGFVFLGGPGLTYRIGVASLFIVLPVGFTAALLCRTLGLQLRKLAAEHDVLTIPDAIGLRYGGRWPRGLSAVAVALGSMAYLGLQLQALGLLLQSILGLESRLPAMLLGLVVIVVYSAAGGIVAGVYSDVLQGGLMLIAALFVFVQALEVSGGWSTMLASIAESDLFGATFLEPLGQASAHTIFGFLFVFGVGVLGQPQMLHKFFMIEDPRKLRFMPAVIGGSQSLCILIWLGIGLAVPALVAQGRLPALTQPDSATPLFLLHFTPDLLTGIALAAVAAAIMSTADSVINVGAAALARDLPRALARPVRNELRWGRVAVVVLGASAALLAYLYGDLIALLGTFAFGTFAAALAPVLVVGFNWDGVSRRAAVASIATGLTLTLLLEFLAKQRWFESLPRPPFAEGVLPSAVSLAASFAVLGVVALWDSRSGSA